MEISTITARLLKEFTLVNIYGKAGTGKTTYALQLLSDFLPENDSPIPFEPTFIWVQASDKFPKKRLIEMYKGDRELLQYLQTHIMVYPKFRITSYDGLCSQLIQLSQKQQKLPFIPTAIIIDNISHYLRLEISRYDDVSLITALMDDFFDTVIIPLVFYCGRRDISLILIHEVSYNPKQDKTVMFNQNLFSNLKSLNIKLETHPVTNTQKISFNYQNYSKTYRYNLRNTGIELRT